MFKIESESELKAVFRGLDQDEIFLAPDLRFPLGVRDYLTWSEPSGYRIYLVFRPDSAPPLGIVFRRDQGAGTPGVSHASMCEWCHSVRGGDGVTLLTAAASSKKRVGLNLCRDLSCKDKARGLPGANDFPTGADARAKLARITQKMTDFARHELF